MAITPRGSEPRPTSVEYGKSCAWHRSSAGTRRLSCRYSGADSGIVRLGPWAVNGPARSSMREREAGQIVDLQAHLQPLPGVTGIGAGIEHAAAAGRVQTAGAPIIRHDGFGKFPPVQSAPDRLPAFAAIIGTDHHRLGAALTLAPAAGGTARQRRI